MCALHARRIVEYSRIYLWTCGFKKKIISNTHYRLFLESKISKWGFAFDVSFRYIAYILSIDIFTFWAVVSERLFRVKLTNYTNQNMNPSPSTD